MQQQQKENGEKEDSISKSTKHLNSVMIKTIGDLLEPIMSDMTNSEATSTHGSSGQSSVNANKPAEISEAAQAQINQRMEVMVNEVFKPLVNELKNIFGSPEAILDFSGSETKIIPLASNSGSKIEFLTKLNITKGQSVVTTTAAAAAKDGGTTTTAGAASTPQSQPLSSKKKKAKKGPQNSVKKFGEDDQLPLNIECFHNNCDVTAESWPALERHLEESHGFTSLSQSAKRLETGGGSGGGDSLPQFSPSFSLAHQLQTPRSVRERWADLVAIVRTPNVKAVWMEDVIEGEEELERLHPRRPPKDDTSDSEEEEEEYEADWEETETENLESSTASSSSFTCSEKDCSVLVHSVRQLNHHLIHQHGVMPHTCLVCNDVFDNNMYGSALYSHSWRRHRHFAGTYCCQHCEQTFGRHGELSEHIHLHHMATTISAFDLNSVGGGGEQPPSTTSASKAQKPRPQPPPAITAAAAAATTTASRHHSNGPPLCWAFDYSQPPGPLDHTYNLLQPTDEAGQADLSEEELMAQYFSSLTPHDYIYQLAEMADAIAAAEAAAASEASGGENQVQS